jgi:hypothetical protein
MPDDVMTSEMTPTHNMLKREEFTFFLWVFIL